MGNDFQLLKKPVLKKRMGFFSPDMRTIDQSRGGGLPGDVEDTAHRNVGSNTTCGFS